MTPPANPNILNDLRAQIETAVSHADSANPPIVSYPAKPWDIPYSVELYQHLQQATEQNPAFPRHIDLAPSPLDRIPLIGNVWLRLRRQLHSIALFYANRALKQQTAVTHHLLTAVGQLTALSQQQQRQINQLQAQLKDRSGHS